VPVEVSLGFLVQVGVLFLVQVGFPAGNSIYNLLAFQYLSFQEPGLVMPLQGLGQWVLIQ
jgi:hypothetical protein|tara:strand:- start:668 stop:847 length:180 start_codon:yes stop_codon:yes gene_type:complete